MTEAKTKEYAVIETGGKQYSVSVGNVISIEKLPEEEKKNGKVTFEKVLLVDDGENATIGTPYIKGAKVTGELTEEGKDKKIRVVRFKNKNRYFKQTGQRPNNIPFRDRQGTASPGQDTRGTSDQYKVRRGFPGEMDRVRGSIIPSVDLR